MLALTGDELKEIIVEAIRQVDAAGTELRDTHSIHVGMPLAVDFVADVFKDTDGNLITTNVSSSVQAESETVQVQSDTSNSTDTGSSESIGQSTTNRTGGNSQTSENEYKEY